LCNRQRRSGYFKGEDCPILSRICRLNGSQIENTDFFDSIGHKRKGSQRAYSVRITPKSGHR
jgi:hypothetical protein